MSKDGDEPPGFQRHTAKAIWTDAVKMVILKVETGMDKRTKETIKLIANILGNIAAISVGVAFFEGHPQGLVVSVIFAILAIGTIRSLK